MPPSAPASASRSTEVPGAPWTCRCEAVVWFQAPAILGGLVRYLDTPVGPYNEVFAARAVAPLRGTVPFMAVDSETSMAGGRGNWNLPKELAGFRRGAVSGDGWEVAVRARLARLPALPIAAASWLVQPDLPPAKLSARGRGRPAWVTVESQGTPLLSGRYPGLRVDEATFVLGAPA